MGRTEAQKRAHIKYRENHREKINNINNLSNKKRYKESEERREKALANSKKQYIKRKEKLEKDP